MPFESPFIERRAAPRRAAGGRMRLRPESPFALPVVVDLADCSDSGFRAQHHCPTLTTGQTVWFEFEEFEGRARVVWTKVVGTEIESGFVYLPRE